MIGSAAALGPDDIITCQYRETGMFLQRGFTLKDFMSQLTANHNDPGKGRNMPVHYSGKLKVGAVSAACFKTAINKLIPFKIACRCFDPWNSDPSRNGSCLCIEDESHGKPE